MTCGTIYRARHGSVMKLPLHLKGKRHTECAAGVDLKSRLAGKRVCSLWCEAPAAQVFSLKSVSSDERKHRERNCVSAGFKLAFYSVHLSRLNELNTTGRDC